MTDEDNQQFHHVLLVKADLFSKSSDRCDSDAISLIPTTEIYCRIAEKEYYYSHNLF